MSFHPDVMAPAQQAVLRRLSPIAARRDFRLGGGTAIAIRIGHRRSVDLDWFTAEMGDPLDLAGFLRDAGIDLLVESVDEGTLHGQSEGVRLSFLEYRYPILEAPEEWPESGCRLLSLVDLACMKLSAVAGRGSRRDFVDVFALGRSGLRLADMLSSYRQKFGTEDIGHLVMSLTYFDDAEGEDMPDMLWDVGWDEVKRTIERWVRDYAPSPRPP